MKTEDKLNAVKFYIKNKESDLWTEIEDSFIEGRFNFFNNKGLSIKEIAENIIDEFSLPIEY